MWSVILFSFECFSFSFIAVFLAPLFSVVCAMILYQLSILLITFFEKKNLSRDMNTNGSFYGNHSETMTHLSVLYVHRNIERSSVDVCLLMTSREKNLCALFCTAFLQGTTHAMERKSSAKQRCSATRLLRLLTSLLFLATSNLCSLSPPKGGKTVLLHILSVED